MQKPYSDKTYESCCDDWKLFEDLLAIKPSFKFQNGFLSFSFTI